MFCISACQVQLEGRKNIFKFSICSLPRGGGGSRRLGQSPKFDTFFFDNSPNGCMAMFSISQKALGIAVPSDFTKCKHMCNRASNKKSKPTLLSLTFKVEEKKVYSDFHFEAN